MWAGTSGYSKARRDPGGGELSQEPGSTLPAKGCATYSQDTPQRTMMSCPGAGRDPRTTLSSLWAAVGFSKRRWWLAQWSTARGARGLSQRQEGDPSPRPRSHSSTHSSKPLCPLALAPPSVKSHIHTHPPMGEGLGIQGQGSRRKFCFAHLTARGRTGICLGPWKSPHRGVGAQGEGKNTGEAGNMSSTAQMLGRKRRSSEDA